MEALSLLSRRGVGDVRSVVIGKGESKRWHHLAAKLGLQRNLTFIGATERVRAFHHAGDLLVHPTYYDPCSRVVLEAMSAGLPCITTRWDGAAEMIEEGVSGYVVEEPWYIELLADRVDRLRRPDLRRAIGAAAATTARSVSMERHTAEILALYEACVAGAVSRV